MSARVRDLSMTIDIFNFMANLMIASPTYPHCHAYYLLLPSGANVCQLSSRTFFLWYLFLQIHLGNFCAPSHLHAFMVRTKPEV
jgi:hypothetical protein